MKIIAEHFYLETHQHETVLGAWHQSKGGVSLCLRYICSPQAYILKGGGGWDGVMSGLCRKGLGRGKGRVGDGYKGKERWVEWVRFVWINAINECSLHVKM